MLKIYICGGDTVCSRIDFIFCNTQDPHDVGVLRYIRHSSRITTIGYDTVSIRPSKSLSNREMWSAKILTRQLVDQGSVCEFSHQAAKEQSGLSFAKLKGRLKCYFPAGLRFLDPRTEDAESWSWWMFDLLSSTKIILHHDYFADAFKTKFSTNCIVGYQSFQ